MHAASREALETVSEYFDTTSKNKEKPVAVAAQTGAELFDVVELLDGDRALRITIAEASLAEEQRAEVVSAVFAGKVSQYTLELLIMAARQVWSTPKEMRTGLVTLGRRALLRAAEHQGQLEQVEEELFRLSRLLLKQPELTLLLDDRSADPVAKRDLLAKVLYGKVTAVTEALALQVIGRPERNAIDDVNALSEYAAALRGHKVAVVTSANALTKAQHQTLATKLEGIYAHPMSLHTEVDPSLIGGAIIRVGYEVIDGSTSGKIARLRAQLV